MKARGLLGTGLIVAGLALCGAAALHYWRGTVAQREGRAELERLRPTAVDPITLAPSEKPRLTLITCYPFNYIGPAPQPLVLIAEPLPPGTRHSS